MPNWLLPVRGEGRGVEQNLHQTEFVCMSKDGLTLRCSQLPTICNAAAQLKGEEGRIHSWEAALP